MDRDGGNLMNCERIDEAIAAFPIETAVNGSLVEKSPYGNGHINDTFLLRCQAPGHHEKIGRAHV